LASVTFGKKHLNVENEEIRSSYDNLHAPLLWLARAQMERGDSVGVALIVMLMRHRKAVEPRGW
jgi:hypothetical protein